MKLRYLLAKGPNKADVVESADDRLRENYIFNAF